MSEEHHGDDAALKCHVCESLLPLLDRISKQLSDLEAQQPRASEEEGLRYDLDKVFESLNNAIDERETEILALLDERSRDLYLDDELTSLMTHLNNAKAYCDKALVYTTKLELLRLTGRIHDRVEELLEERDPEGINLPNGITFEDTGFPDLMTEIETFGKIFNEKDVNAAVQEKSFPQEHEIENNLMQKESSTFPLTEEKLGTAQEPPTLVSQTDESCDRNGVDDQGGRPSQSDLLKGSLTVSNGITGDNDQGYSYHGVQAEDLYTPRPLTTNEQNESFDAIVTCKTSNNETFGKDNNTSDKTHDEIPKYPNYSFDETINPDDDVIIPQTVSQQRSSPQDKGSSFQPYVQYSSDEGRSYSYESSPDDTRTLDDEDIMLLQKVAQQGPACNTENGSNQIGSVPTNNEKNAHPEDVITSQTVLQQTPRDPFGNYSDEDRNESAQGGDSAYVSEGNPSSIIDEDQEYGPGKDEQGSSPTETDTVGANYGNPFSDSFVPHHETNNNDNYQSTDTDDVKEGSSSVDDYVNSQTDSNITSDGLSPHGGDTPGQTDRNDLDASSAKDADNDSKQGPIPLIQLLQQARNLPFSQSQEKEKYPTDEKSDEEEATLNDQPIFHVQSAHPAAGVSLFIKANYDDVDLNAPATIDTMSFCLQQDPDSELDATLTIWPKKYSVESVVKCVYMEFDKATVYEENHVTRDGKLVNEPPILPHQNTSWRFKNYKGALSTRPFDSTGMSYLEFWTDIEIKQAHDGRSLIFEAAVADRDVIDLYHKAEGESHAWGISLSHCPEHNGLCRRTWAAGEEVEHFLSTLPNRPKSKAQLRFGFLYLQKQKKLVIIDCNKEKVLMTAENITITRPLWPVFGVYNTELSHVETQLVCSTKLQMDRNIAWLILQSM